MYENNEPSERGMWKRPFQASYEQLFAAILNFKFSEQANKLFVIFWNIKYAGCNIAEILMFQSKSSHDKVYPLLNKILEHTLI